MNIAEKIVSYRKAKNLTQSQLADLLFVSDKTVSKWETGRGYPEISILPKLASVLGTTVDDLLQEVEPVVPEADTTSGELPPANLPPVNDGLENKLVLSRSKSLIVWICTVFIPMGLLTILSFAAMLSGYANAVETGLLLLLLNAIGKGLIALSLYLSFKDSRGLLIMAIYFIIVNTISLFTNYTWGIDIFSLVPYLLSLATNILVILFALRKLKKTKAIIILLWISFAAHFVIAVLTFRTDFPINTFNDVIMILVSCFNVVGFTLLYPMFEMRRVPPLKKSTFFKDPE